MTHVLQENTEKSRHTTPERVPQDNNLVSFAMKLDQVVHHLSRGTDMQERGRRKWGEVLSLKKMHQYSGRRSTTWDKQLGEYADLFTFDRIVWSCFMCHAHAQPLPQGASSADKFYDRV